jgi:hypothetical protein
VKTKVLYRKQSKVAAMTAAMPAAGKYSLQHWGSP